MGRDSNREFWIPGYIARKKRAFFGRVQINFPRIVTCYTAGNKNSDTEENNKDGKQSNTNRKH